MQKILLFIVFFSSLFNIYGQRKISLDTLNKTIYLGEFKLNTPSSILSKYKYDEKSNRYILVKDVGDLGFDTKLSLSAEEYRNLFKSNFIKSYFNEQYKIIESDDENEKRNLLPNLYINSNFLESIFGGNEIDLNPQGSVGIDLGARYLKRENPSIPVRNQSNINLDFNQAISLSLNGKIGEKVKFKTNYDSQSTFDFQNLIKLEYNPNEDDIIQNVEIGNVSMPISGSLITGAQSLFGFKTKLKFGATTIDAVFSEQRSQSSTIEASSDGNFNEFSIFPLDYDSNRHFFLAQYFKENYDNFLSTYPFINSTINITRVEVWVTNQVSETENTRNIIALQDIGESNPESTKIAEYANEFILKANSLPDNSVNNFDPNKINQNFLNEEIRDITNVDNGFNNYSNLILEGRDYVVLENARKLNENEYSINTILGYISLNQSLENDEVLSIAFQYTENGNVYQVGEFSSDGINYSNISSNGVLENNSLIVKMLKSNISDVSQPNFMLMMKNIYDLGTYGLNTDDFRLNIFYSDPSPLNYISAVDSDTWPKDLEKIRLLNLFELDKLDSYQNIQNGGDGFFDAIDGVTVSVDKGLLIFPTIEPFGKFLFEKLRSSDVEDYDEISTHNENQKKYVFKNLYENDKTSAEKFEKRNKFNLKGRYKASTNDSSISTGEYNIPQGSIVVTAGGRLLQEGIDYLVNYQTGDVEILNESLKNSGIPIEISTESNSFYSQQKRRFSGINIEHKFSDKLIVGGTILNLSEKSISRKSNYGFEPVNNTSFGINVNYNNESPFLTRITNFLPNINSNAPSSISLRSEFAYLKSSDPRKSGFDSSASVYIDDFEGTQNKIDLRDANSWKLSSVPVDYGGFSYGNNDLKSGFHRAKLSWYSIDPIFYSSRRPAEISNDELSFNSTRRIYINEIFPELDLYQGESRAQTTLDLTYYPNEKGPYNNNTIEEFSNEGDLQWAAITKNIITTNFKKSNVEYIQFWLLDDFNNYNSNDFEIGEIVFHLGNISEDILLDGKKQYENGLPSKSSDLYRTTNWGITPSNQSILYAFDADAGKRKLQDLGYDGLNDSEEKNYYTNGPDSDPAGDNYEYYLQREGNILNRYKNYNGTQGNSPVDVSSTYRGSTTLPDVEDVNNDNTMNRVNSYFEYRIPIFKNITKENHPFVSDIRVNNSVTLSNGDNIKSRWIQFKVPIFPEHYEGTRFNQYFRRINGINDLKSIRFIRLAVKGFDEPVTLRFATLDLIKSDWKRYNLPLNKDQVINNETTFEVGSVNILDNENRSPINYVLPPGIEREEINTNNSIIRQNEQSLSLKVEDLKPMDYRAVYKNIELDLRQYKKIKMFIHAESIAGKELLPGDGVDNEYDDRLVAFLRLGNDINENYYQVEVPLKPTSFLNANGERLSPEKVWNPENNSIELDIEIFKKIKMKLISEKINSTESNYFDENLNLIDEFSQISNLPDDKKYKFSIKGNPSIGKIKTLTLGLKNPSSIIGKNLTGEVWFNELRVSEINNQDGWAAIANFDANLSDFANVSFSGRMSTDGFGSIDKSPNERVSENYTQYGLVTNVNAGQLFPENWGINIPLSYTFSKELTRPKYDSFYDDIEIDNLTDKFDNKDSILNQSATISNSKSFSILGLSKSKTNQKKQRFYDIENLNFSYSYAEKNLEDFEMEYSKRKKLLANAIYSHRFNSTQIFPFERFFKNNKSKYFNWIRQFNFNPLPTSILFSGNFDRSLFKQKFREVNYSGVVSENQIPTPEFIQTKYLFDWRTSITYNISKSMVINYNSSNSNIVSVEDDDDFNYDSDIYQNLLSFGSPNYFNQSFNLSYNLPFSLLPFLNFIDANYAYSGDFNWQKGPDILNSIIDEDGNRLGLVNTIQNSNKKDFNISFNLERLYRDLNIFSSKNKITELLKSIKRIRSTYSENTGKVLPGYLPSIGFLGTLKPSFEFIFGGQKDIRFEMAKKGWLTDFPNFNEQYKKVFSSSFNFSAELKPFRGLNVDITSNRSFSRNYSENFSVSDFSYLLDNKNFYGNLSVSSSMILTSFSKKSIDFSKNFENLKKDRLIIANRLIENKELANVNFDEDGFPIGFGKNSQAVLIPAFISAYTGKDPKDISLNPINYKPKLNWTIQYDGLSKNLQKYFRKFSLQHGYRSSFTINNFNYNLNYSENSVDKIGNYQNENLFSNINLVEQFNPLLRIDMEFKNSLRLVFDIIKDRAISLSLANNLITESWGDEFTIGVGYRIKKLRIRSSLAENSSNFIGDLNTKIDLSLRKNISVIRNLDLENNKVSAGQSVFSMKASADYALNKNFSAIFFYDHLFSKYQISTSFPQTNIRSGFTFRYTFGN